MSKRSWVLAVVAITSVACGSGSSSNGAGGTTTATPGTGGTAGGATELGGGGAGGSNTLPDAAIVGTGGNTVSPAEAGVAFGTGGIAAGTGGISGGGGSGTAGTSSGGSAIDAGAGTPVTPDAGPSSNGGAGGSTRCDKDLSGTWDLFATSVGSGIVKGTLVISADGFSLTSNGAELTYKTNAPTATWKYDSYYSGPSTRVISVQRTPAPANTGSVPIAIAGQWILQSNTETCVLDVGPDTLSGKCTGPLDDEDVPASDWPSTVLPSPRNRVTYSASRTGALASQFGDFGGTWAAQSSSGSGESCNVRLEGSGVSTSCHASNMFNGAMHLTVGADCVASGVTPSGMEVSARRR
jgi:hypothetical protein